MMQSSFACNYRLVALCSFVWLVSSVCSAYRISLFPIYSKAISSNKNSVVSRFPIVSSSNSKYLSSLEHMSSSSQSNLSSLFAKIIGKSAKYVVSFVVAGILLFNESLLPLYYVTFAVLNSLFGKFLKNVIKQPRPIHSSKRGYGMPSSHTTAISFFTVIVVFKGSKVIPYLWLQKVTNLLVVAYGILACHWRIESHLHTASQIVAGAVLGTSFAMLSILLEDQAIGALTAAIGHIQSSTEIPVLLSAKIVMVCMAGLVVFSRNLRHWWSQFRSKCKS